MIAPPTKHINFNNDAKFSFLLHLALALYIDGLCN